MKSETVTTRDKRTNFRTVEVKSDALNDKGEKLLGLFEDNSFGEEEIFLTRAQNNFASSAQAAKLYIFSLLILTLVSNFCQLGKT